MVHASRRSPGTGLYIIQDACESPERFKLDLLQRAWRELARRYPILRSRVETHSDGAMWQHALDDAFIEWREIDWTTVAPEQIPERLAEFLRNDRKRSFDLETEIPSRFTLLRTASGSTLVWTAHHVLLDGRSYVLAWNEMLRLYDDIATGARPPEHAAEAFYKHVAWASAQDLAAAEQYWRERLGGLNATSHIVDRLPGAAKTRQYDTAKESRTQTIEFSAAVSSFAHEHGVTVATVIQGAWAVLLSRYSGSRDVAFGVTRSGRHSVPGAGEIVGVLINTIPFRVILDPEATVAGFLQTIRRHSIEAREYETHAARQHIGMGWCATGRSVIRHSSGL